MWEQCDVVSKLPTDNKKAVLKICLTELKLLKDACEEVDKVRVFVRGMALLFYVCDMICSW